MPSTEHPAASRRINPDVFLEISAKAYAGAERLTTLNLQVVKSSLGESAQASLAALAAKDPQSLLALQMDWLRPAAAERASSYGRQLLDIVARTKDDVEKLIAEQAAGMQELYFAAIDAAATDGIEGSSAGMAFLTSAVTRANGAFDGPHHAGVARANAPAVRRAKLKSARKSRQV